MGLMLSAVCVCGLICVPPAGAAETVSTFPDVTDAQVGRAVEALRTMGVIDGSGGRYEPEGNLTRAQFCKMAIEVMGKGDEAEAEASRTIFNDVPGRHWARGYVNLAATTTVGGDADGKGAARLMMGQGNGSFAPDRAITYAEAVTTLLRILGYSKQANSNWPSGAVATAASVGLDNGFTPPTAREPITRAQAALLFCNLLTAPMEGDKGIYASSLGTVQENWLLVSLDAKTASGQEGAVQFYDKEGKKDPVLPAVRTPASFVRGTQGTAVIKDGRLLTFIPSRTAVSKAITVAEVTLGSTCTITGSDGNRINLKRDTMVLGGEEPDKFVNVHNKLLPGTYVVACFAPSGSVDYLYIESFGVVDSVKSGVMVAKDKVSGNPFAQLTAGTTDYKIVKNGAEATLSDLKQYDVASYNADTKTLYVSDFRVSCVYQEASPNAAAPTKIKTALFEKELDVLDCAIDDLKQFRFGDTFTLLLTTDGKVAGAVKTTEARSNAVGYVEGGELKLLNAPSELPKLAKPDSLDKYLDCLVSVAGSKTGITLSRLSGRSTRDTLNMKTRMLGDAPLADNVAVFDRIANSGIQKVTLDDVTVDRVAADKIVYQRTNAGGKVDLLVLENVTGDLYTYGIAEPSTESAGTVPTGTDTGDGKDETEDNNGSSSIELVNNTTLVLNKSHPTAAAPALKVVGGTTYRRGQFIGLAASLSKLSGSNTPRHASSILLKSVEKVTPANFNLSMGLFFSGSVELPIWEEGVQCYNAQTKTWFSSGETAMENLKACLAYSSNLTVYYDRDPAQGGKVRIVAAN